jgi:hypothetical protein
VPDSQPNYLTVDPATGNIGANFSGHVQATGIDMLDADPTEQDYAVRWHRVTDGSTNAYVYGTTNSTQILQRGSSSGYVKIDSMESAAGVTSYATVIANADAVRPADNTEITVDTFKTGGPNTRSVLMNANGYSDFQGHMIWDSGYIAGPTFISTGSTLTGGATPVRAKPGGTPYVLLSLSGYLQHNGTNGVLYSVGIYWNIDGIANYGTLWLESIQGRYGVVAGTMVVAMSPGAHTVTIFGNASAYPAIGLYTWRASAFQLA